MIKLQTTVIPFFEDGKEKLFGCRQSDDEDEDDWDSGDNRSLSSGFDRFAESFRFGREIAPCARISRVYWVYGKYIT
jgi:hypothetical protein